MDASDKDIFAAYCLGSELAFEQIYRRYGNRVYGYALKKTRKEEFAKEIVQEVFFKIHRCRDSYDRQYPLSAWIFTITRSVIVDFYRKNPSLVGLDIEQLEDRSAESVSLELLSEEERCLIKERFFFGKTYRELEKEIGVSSSSLRKRVERIIKRLRKIARQENVTEQ